MRVLLPLPARDFDPTESGVPWSILRDADIEVVFATPDGQPASGDDRMLSGRGLAMWSPILRATPEARATYEAMSTSPEFRAPMAYSDIDEATFDALLLPGGHAPGMKPYLESKVLHRIAAAFVWGNRPVGAICHGVIVLARSAAIGGKQVTALTKAMELSAWGMTALWLGSYYRTYPETVQSEVERAIGASGAFHEGPFAVLRDTPSALHRGFTVRDGNLLTARWPGDAHRFAHEFVDMLKLTPPRPRT